MSWERYRLKHLAGINARALPEHTPEDLEFRYIDISTVGRGRLVAEPQLMRFGQAPSRARRLVKPGDTIISTVRTYLRAVYPIPESANDLVVSTGFAVISPGALIDPRFLAWWTQSDVCVEEVVARSVGVSYPAINAGDIGDLEVRLPNLVEQREIADFVDAETARIDAIIEKKRRLAMKVSERFGVLERRMTLGSKADLVPIRWGIRVTSGEAFPLELVRDEGCLAVVGGNGRISR